jgi:hypothetical protein
MAITKQFRKAAAILAAFEDMYGEQCEAHASCYSNGREQGFALTIFHWEEYSEAIDGFEAFDADVAKAPVTMLFSEGRSSDAIMVYEVQGLHESLTDEAYANAHSFHPDEYTKAAEYMWKRLTAKERRRVAKPAGRARRAS